MFFTNRVWAPLDSDGKVMRRISGTLTLDKEGNQSSCKSLHLSYLCGATTKNGDVAAASDLYRDGVGCGACYQVRCMNSKDCSFVITNQGSSDRADLIMSKKASRKIAQSTYAASSLLSQGIVHNEHRDSRDDAVNGMAWLRGVTGEQALLCLNFQSGGMFPWKVTGSHWQQVCRVSSGDAFKQLLQFRRPVQYLQQSGTHTPGSSAVCAWTNPNVGQLAEVAATTNSSILHILRHI